ncbi:hypothetical protein FSARC_14923 [Fusarium sarcochroum]|uniref:SnoaL-like domain-containing protein n=1 Tax=Fusarium sarcochroum TaxID=1208366 RepID=A0A8H4SPW2_9HYPO|nr:hypothetical protein FSARC_14923 [Fusarium sarcochroum]
MSSPAPTHDQLLSNIKAATKSVFEAFHAGSTEGLLPNASDSFAYYIHPASVNLPPMTRAGFLEFWATSMAPNLSNFTAEFHTEVYDVENRKSTVYLSSTADTPLGPGTWTNEAVFMSQFTDDGKTLLRVDELLDSAFYKDFMAKIEGLKQQKAGGV